MRFIKLVASLLCSVGLLASPSICFAQEGPPPVPVETMLPKIESVEETTAATGELLAKSAVIITSEVPGRIKEVNFKDGSPVKAGDALYVLDKALLNAELAQRQASYDNAKSQYDRLEKLMQSGSGNVSTRDDARAQLNIEAAQLELINARLEQMTLRAPYDGIAGLSKVEAGDYVTPGMPLVNFVDIDTLKIDFKIPETYLSKLRVNQKLSLEFSGFKEQAFTGELVAISPIIDTKMHSISLRGQLENKNRILRPGLFTKVNLVLETRDSAILVPESAVQLSNDGPFVYVITDDNAVMTPVTLGIRKDDWVEIVKGLDINSKIVTSGQNRLYNGAKTYPSES